MNWLLYIGGGWVWLLFVGGFFNTVIRNGEKPLGGWLKGSLLIAVELVWIWLCWRWV